ncbi:hypothetical protein PHLGIDRAFT_391313 [Phlebiopsis gigantea 11061_1 CR5-6]|uniref:Uncharacterized protein n=1 Tax=Phlebiopsis gigantea (strain 11061_1 CR5-6) TaxID=745531 RepID=A0A0C3RZZ4_PHLG1|nr:hypothetical protein PHLGIDRAFT_391313 [Phlebiopsis gigantea 11061_1 CR5-6]
MQLGNHSVGLGNCSRAKPISTSPGNVSDVAPRAPPLEFLCPESPAPTRSAGVFWHSSRCEMLRSSHGRQHKPSLNSSLCNSQHACSCRYRALCLPCDCSLQTSTWISGTRSTGSVACLYGAIVCRSVSIPGSVARCYPRPRHNSVDDRVECGPWSCCGHHRRYPAADQTSRITGDPGFLHLTFHSHP